MDHLNGRDLAIVTARQTRTEPSSYSVNNLDWTHGSSRTMLASLLRVVPMSKACGKMKKMVAPTPPTTIKIEDHIN